MNEITPTTLCRQIAYLNRCMVDVAVNMFIAQLDDDGAEYSRLEIEYRWIEWNRAKLITELRALIALISEQLQAVAEAERILQIGG